MKKILLCSPYYPDKEITTCGIANWTRNIMSRQSQDSEIQVDLLPFDRSVDLDEESTYWERITSGIKDYIGLVLKAKNKLRKGQYDVIQVSTSASLGFIRDYLIAKIARRMGVKPVFHYHFGRMPEVLEGSNWESKLLHKILKISYASIVMDRQSFEALNSRGYKVDYLPNPLSEKNFQIVNKLRETSTRHINQLLFVGHVVPTKGVFELVEAATNIRDVKVKIVGRVFADTKQRLQEIAQKRDSGTWLSFVGEIPHDDVLKEMLECDIYVLPTYTEGFPNVILEAMACSCPIVTCSVGAIPEMLDSETDSPCGIVIEPKNADLLEASIKALQNDSEKKNVLGARARKKIVENYTVDAVWKQLESIWQSYMAVNKN